MKVKIKQAPKQKGNHIPLTDDLLQIVGPSHANGGTPFMGIEAEGQEVAYKGLDNSTTIFGNMYNPLTGNKFKQDAKNIGKKEQKVDKLLNKGTYLVNNYSPDNPWDRLKFNAGQAMATGAEMKKEELKANKEHLSALQQAMLEMAGEMGADPFWLSKGKIKQAKNGMKLEYENGGKIQEKYKALKEKTEAKLKALYPGSSISIREDGARDISSQRGLVGTGASKTSVSLHNFDAARDYIIYIDGKPVKDKAVYKKTLHQAAEELGLHTIGDWDPYHVGLVQEGKKNSKGAFADLMTQYPELKESKQYKSSVDYLTNLVKKGEADEQEINAYRQLTGDAGSYKAKKINYKNYKPTLSKDKQYMGESIVDTPYEPPALPDYPVGKEKQKPGPRTVKYGDYPLEIDELGNPKIPSNAKGLEFYQIAPELVALGQNKVEPVWMQKYQPQLYQPYQVSFQDRLNENQTSFNSLERILEDNPTALATLAGQKYAADNSVRGEEFRTNQQIEQDIVNKNIALLNDAQLKNLSLADTQYTRQAQAKSNTKAINNTILNSISGKIAQNNLEQQTLKAYENLYNFRMTPDGRTMYYGPKGWEYVNWGVGAGETKPGNQTLTEKKDASGNVISTSTKTASDLDTENKQLQNKKLQQNIFLPNPLLTPNKKKNYLWEPFENGGNIPQFWNSLKKR